MTFFSKSTYLAEIVVTEEQMIKFVFNLERRASAAFSIGRTREIID